MTSLKGEVGVASQRLTKALDIACRYTGGMVFGEGDEGMITFADMRDLIDQHADLLEALTKIAALDQHSGASLRDRAASEIARAAIAKASALTSLKD